VEGDEVPRFMGVKKMSLHQTGFQEVISAAALTGKLPEELLLIGVQPEELDDYGGSLRPVVKARLGEAVDMALEQLRHWGYVAQPRHVPVEPRDSALAMATYEAGRPSVEAACRFGDERFMHGA
jgi:hydrogenase maturation protease